MGVARDSRRRGARSAGDRRASTRASGAVAPGPSARAPKSLHDHVYGELRRMVMLGRFQPGQKIKIRTLAAALGTSLTPVREALRRLVAEGAFVGEPNRSVRMPAMTVERVRELRDIRVVVEGYAARRAAERIDPATIRRLRELHLEILVARDNRDVALDIAKLREFHMTLYLASGMSSIIAIIESLFLQTGPWINLLFPGYAKGKRGEQRLRIIRALEAGDAAAVEREIREDIATSFDYIAQRVADLATREHAPARRRAGLAL
jgi:DNA-binding GntR family transcriptional regulator